jgi:Bacterial membrane protein YfhO
MSLSLPPDPRPRWPVSRGDLWAGGVLLAVALFFFRDAVLGRGVLFRRDISLVWYPQVESFVRCIAAGSWPLWDPYRGFGQPLLADPSAEILYPFTWLNLVAPPWIVYTVFVVVHLAFSGIGVYALARRLDVSRGGALAAGLAWTCSGPYLSLASTWHHMAGAAWIPWNLLAADLALEARSWPRALLWGAALAAQVLAGSADMVAMTLVAVALDALVRHVEWARPLGLQNRDIAITATLAVASGLAFSAAQWVPTVQMSLGTARLGLAAGARTTWSLHPLGLLETVLPFRWNSLPLSVRSTKEILEFREPWLHSIYVGIPLLALAIAGATGQGWRRRAAFSLMALGAPLVALGHHWLAYRFVVWALPPLRILRFPVKAMVIAAFGAAVLAGFGFDRWREDPRRRSRTWGLTVAVPAGLLFLAAGIGTVLSTVGTPWWAPALLLRDARLPPYPALLAPTAARLLLTTVLAGLVFALSRSRDPAGRWQSWAVAAVMMLDLGLAHADLHPVGPRAIVTHRPALVSKLRPGIDRVYVYDYSTRSPGQAPLPPGANPFQPKPTPAGWSPLQFVTLAALDYLTPPTGGRWGLYGSYDLDLLGLQPRPLAELNDLLRREEGTPAHTRLLQMGNVAHVVDLAPPSRWPGLSLEAVVPGLFREPARVYRVPNPLPRAFVVGRTVVADGREALAAVVAPAFDPHVEMVVANPAGREAAAGFHGHAEVLELKPDRVEVAAALTAPGYLVLADAYDPGWSALVDGKPSHVMRANLAFRAVALAGGSHRVEFRYRPRWVLLGLAISAASAIAALAGVARTRERAS